MREQTKVVNAVRLEDLKVGDRVWDSAVDRYLSVVCHVHGCHIELTGKAIVDCFSCLHRDWPKNRFFWGPPTLTGPEKPARKVKGWLWCVDGNFAGHHTTRWVETKERHKGITLELGEYVKYGPFEVEMEEEE